MTCNLIPTHPAHARGVASADVGAGGAEAVAASLAHAALELAHPPTAGVARLGGAHAGCCACFVCPAERLARPAATVGLGSGARAAGIAAVCRAEWLRQRGAGARDD